MQSWKVNQIFCIGQPSAPKNLEPLGSPPYTIPVQKSLWARWQANFLAGLAIVMPAVISFAVLIWLFGTVSNITDKLLIFLPQKLTHREDGTMFWYWSAFALVLTVFLIGVVGLLARNYFGKRVIEWADSALLRIPLLNKIYGATKQVNDAFSSGNKTAFRTVVLVEYPRVGVYSVGFITSEPNEEIRAKTKEKVVCVFVPTTPNPTGGFLLLVPEDQVTRLDMSVADGIKYIISLGAINPEHSLAARREIKPAQTDLTVARP
jgi:uncharacterized membrane protein